MTRAACVRPRPVWEYLRSNKLSQLVWDTYRAIVAACKAAWDFIINDPNRIASIGLTSWAERIGQGAGDRLHA
jgi:hypothetical protein